MKHKFSRTIVVSLGGSILCPDQIDVGYIKKIRQLILKYVRTGHRFILVTGGGRTCRAYQQAAQTIAPVTSSNRDWVGIYANRLNAQLVRSVFLGLADPVVWDAPAKIKKLGYPVTIGAGWAPGWSTDYVTVRIAHQLKVSEIINIGKPDYVYSANPDKDPQAKPFSDLTWSQYRKIIPGRWVPGAHAPLDPVAARFCQKNKMSVYLVGKDLNNFEKLLGGKECKGTTISN